MAMRATVNPGTVGSGHGVDLVGEEVPQEATEDDPQGDPDDSPEADGHARLPRHGGGQLATGETEGLQQRQVVAAAADRRHQREAEGDHRPGAEAGAEEGRDRPHGPVVDDLGRALHGEHVTP